MHRLPLILCAIALIGATLSGVLYFEIGNSKKALELRLADSAARATTLESSLATANQQNGSLKAKVAALDADLANAATKTAAAESRATQAERDFIQAKAVLGIYEQTARALGEEVAALRQDLADIRATHAPPEAVAAYKNTIGELERQLANAHNGAAAPTAAGAANAVFSSRPGRATVLNVGPENAFVVLNFGSARGAALGQKMSLSQGTSVVAEALITDVRPNFSIAQVLPDTLRGVLQKGDSALLLR